MSDSASPIKYSYSGLWSPKHLAWQLRSLGAAQKSLPKSLTTLALSLIRAEPLDAHAQDALEGLFWPMILAPGALPYYVVPIQPQWAARLFDSRTAESSLFESDSQQLLRVRNVYYCNARVLPKGPARILWYVSKGTGNYPFAGGIAATSILDSSLTLSAKQAYSRFRQYGVFKEHHIKELVRGRSDDRVAVLRFSRTLALPSPVPYKKLSAILDAQNISSNNFVSIARLPEAVATRILVEGGLTVES